MIVESSHGTIVYKSGEYWVEVITNSRRDAGVYARHKCPTAGEGNEYVNALLPREVENQKCSRCGKIEMPEELRTLYILFRAGEGKEYGVD